MTTKPELMRQIADAMEKYADGWWREFEEGSGKYSFDGPAHFFGTLANGTGIRPRPRTVRIDVEVPEPMREVPKYGERFWTLAPCTPEGYMRCPWTDHSTDFKALSRGIWPTEHEAQQAADAIFGALGRKV